MNRSVSQKVIADLHRFFVSAAACSTSAMLLDNDAGFCEWALQAARPIDRPIRLHREELTLDPVGQTFIVRIDVSLPFIIWIDRYGGLLDRKVQLSFRDFDSWEFLAGKSLRATCHRADGLGTRIGFTMRRPRLVVAFAVVMNGLIVIVAACSQCIGGSAFLGALAAMMTRAALRSYRRSTSPHTPAR